MTRELFEVMAVSWWEMGDNLAFGIFHGIAMAVSDYEIEGDAILLREIMFDRMYGKTEPSTNDRG